MSDLVNNIDSKPVTVILSGIGGYGYYYLKSLLEDFPEGTVKIAGVVDPFPEKSGLLSELKSKSIPIFSSIEDL